MKKTFFWCAIIVPFLVAAGITTGPVGTSWSQMLLQSTTADEARAQMGLGTNIVLNYDTNQFSLTDSNLAIKSGVSLTNLNVSGNASVQSNLTVLEVNSGLETEPFDAKNLVIRAAGGDMFKGGDLYLLAGGAAEAEPGNVIIRGGIVPVYGVTGTVFIASDLVHSNGTATLGPIRYPTFLPASDAYAAEYPMAEFNNNNGGVTTMGFDETGKFYISGGVKFAADNYSPAMLKQLGEFGIQSTEGFGAQQFYYPVPDIQTNDTVAAFTGLTFVDATHTNITVYVYLNYIYPMPGWSGRFTIKRLDNSTNTVSVVIQDGLIDGKASVQIHPLCSLEVFTQDGTNLISTLDAKMCLPTWMDVSAGAFVLGQGVATPAKVDAYPGAPYKVYAFDDTDAAYFTLQTQHKLAVTNVWFPELIYDRHLHVKLTDTPSAGQSNITVALDYRLAKPNSTFESLVSMTNTVTLAATNTNYMVDWGTITNNNLSGASSVIIEGGIRRISGGAGDITDNVVCFESLDFHFPFEVPLGSNNRTGDQ